jgi:hypothetical protein
MLSFQFLVKSGKSRLTAVIWRTRYVSMFQTLNTCLQQNHENHTYKIITFHHLQSFLTVNRIYSQCITPPREGPGGGRKTHLQVESLLPRLSTDFSVIRSNQVWGFRAFGGLVSRVSGLVWYVLFRGQCLEMLGGCWAQLQNVNICNICQNCSIQRQLQ